MNSMRLPAVLLVAVVVCGLLLQFYYWPFWPEKVAIHFGPDGRANSWTSKSNAVALHVGLVIGLPVFFVVLAYVLGKLPTTLINMPHRDYWLAEPRREASLQWMKGFMLWFGVMTAGFVVYINHLAFVANRDDAPLSNTGFLISLAVYFLLTLSMVVVSYRRFPKPSSISE